MPNTQITRMPAMKNSALQTSTTSMVWPKSGCFTKSATTVSSITNEMVLAGMSGRLADSPNSQATTTTKAGFKNSDGWMFTPKITSQRRAPLISAPKTGVNATRMRLAKNTMTASRLIWRGLRKDTLSSTAMVGKR